MAFKILKEIQRFLYWNFITRQLDVKHLKSLQWTLNNLGTYNGTSLKILPMHVQAESFFLLVGKPVKSLGKHVTSLKIQVDKRISKH